MHKTISVITGLIFLASIYCAPTISAITLGEIKPEKNETESADKADDSKIRNKKTSEENKDAKIPEKKIEEKDKEKSKEEEKEEINPRLVCLLSVIMPGGGHFYLNNDMKGIGFCLAAGIGYTATGYFMVKTMLAETGSVSYKNNLLLTGFLFFITIVIHFVGIIEAYTDADEISREKLFGNDNADSPYITKIIIK